MNTDRFHALGLADIVTKLDTGERLTEDDGVRLFECADLHALGWLANREREKRHGQNRDRNDEMKVEHGIA